MPGLPDPDEDDDPEAALWFLPGPSGDGPAAPPPGLGPLRPADADAAGWAAAEAGLAAALARAAARVGALDDRLSRGPEGWRHRLALVEASELGWWAGLRAPAERIALWLSLRLSGVQDDAQALARLGWAARRLAGGPAPAAGLAAFLGRQDDGAGDWPADAGLHPLTQAAATLHGWPAAAGGRLEAAVAAARIAAADCSGAVFVPVSGGGGGGLRPGGDAAARLARWYAGIEASVLAAMRQLDRLEAWEARAAAASAVLSGRTPPRLRTLLAAWPLVSAPMAEAGTGASRAAVQRNLAWMEDRGLIREITGQGRYRFWTATL